MTSPAGERGLPPPLNSGDSDTDGTGPVPPAPAVTPPEPARDDVLIAAAVGAAISAAIVVGILFRTLRRARARRGDLVAAEAG